MKKRQKWFNGKRLKATQHLALWVAGATITGAGLYLVEHGHAIGYPVHDLGLAPIVTSLWKMFGVEV